MQLDNVFYSAVKTARVPQELTVGDVSRLIYNVTQIPGADKLPRALVVLLENVVRNASDDDAAARAAHRIIEAGLAGEQGEEIEFMPARVLFQDFTGVPVFVDFAAMRDAMVARGGDPREVNPRIPCTLVIDHSVIADCAGSCDAAEKNEVLEATRNRERFAFLKWASKSFDNVEIVPPGGGICHQLNIERFCSVVTTDALSHQRKPVACFDTLVGTDSHTTTANGLGVLGWGVGGIEAEAAALGQPISMLVPPVVELRLTGSLRDGISGMDLALTVARLLREAGVVGTLVEVTGEGVATLSATQRAAVANMTPEYGATTTLFPADEVARDYLKLTGRSAQEVAFAQAFLMVQGLWGEGKERCYARTLELDLSSVETCLAGPSRPHNYVTPAGLRERFRAAAAEHGHEDMSERLEVKCGQRTYSLGHGSIAIAAITSCTTATDPAMMVAAGLTASKAVARGLSAKPWVKRILAPGSHATQLLLERAGLTDALFKLGFYTCGFGCMTCIGNSGDIHPAMHAVADRLELASVLSGNRNFDGRISPDVAQNFLGQPALVVAYALAGTVDVDLSREPLGIDDFGQPVMLSDILPTTAEIDEVLSKVLTPELFAEGAEGLFEGSQAWREIPSSESDTFAWDSESTYVRCPPYFEQAQSRDAVSIEGARALVHVGDFVTTDHISPAGSIAADSPAARYLTEHGVAREDFNTYGSRRGNHEVMMRGTFANIRLQNLLADGRNGGWTRNLVTGEICSVYDAAMAYAQDGVSLIGIAGKLYGSGSSRDWAGKGPALLGIQAVIAESFERIHRSNLVQMGVLPLEFSPGENAQTLGLTGEETFDIETVDLSDGKPGERPVRVVAHGAQGDVSFVCKVRIDTPMESAFMASGGILPYVLDSLA
ncbi:MAG: aconitate hydratase AcnA [Coriobacteriales bacterium]|nr:aconitate hydratase AcnA [Coriobacteriales bacterium]